VGKTATELQPIFESVCEAFRPLLMGGYTRGSSHPRELIKINQSSNYSLRPHRAPPSPLSMGKQSVCLRRRTLTPNQGRGGLNEAALALLQPGIDEREREERRTSECGETF
jgi:hypothetical protein